MCPEPGNGQEALVDKIDTRENSKQTFLNKEKKKSQNMTQTPRQRPSLKVCNSLKTPLLASYLFNNRRQRPMFTILRLNPLTDKIHNLLTAHYIPVKQITTRSLQRVSLKHMKFQHL